MDGVRVEAGFLAAGAPSETGARGRAPVTDAVEGVGDIIGLRAAGTVDGFAGEPVAEGFVAGLVVAVAGFAGLVAGLVGLATVMDIRRGAESDEPLAAAVGAGGLDVGVLAVVLAAGGLLAGAAVVGGFFSAADGAAVVVLAAGAAFVSGGALAVPGPYVPELRI